MTTLLRVATDYDFPTLARVLNGSYADYPVPIQFAPEQLSFFVRSHDVDLSLSVVAERAGEPVGLALLARRAPRGWVAGVGVLPAHRRDGIGRAMMEAIADGARYASIRHLKLEVLQQNEAALRLYEGLGWVVARELLIWSRPTDQGPLPVPDERLVPYDPAALIELGDGWRSEPPCWQRERATLMHYTHAGVRGWALVRGDRPVGYVLGFAAMQGRMALLDVAVDPAIGIRSAGRPLLQAFYHRFADVTPTLVNEPVDSHLNPLFAALTYRVVNRQHEMVLDMASKT